jgi:superfamily II DNA or RNA helicase
MQTLGIYEQLMTQLLSSKLDRDKYFVGERQMETTEAALWLSRFLNRILEYAVNNIPNGDDQLQQQIELANNLLLWLKTHINDDDFIEENLINSQGKILTSLLAKDNPVASNLSQFADEIYPLTGLSQSELFCGSNAGISLDCEIKREILSSDQIYWLVSFIKWSGLRIFRSELEKFTRSGRKLKVITTSYMGATDAKAVEFLANLPNTEVKLSYNTNSERLHAKSYLFLRDTGFNTGYIGSSNLSHSALTSGLEWNLKITSQEIPHIIDKAMHTFETYWYSTDFELFDGTQACKQKLNNALSSARRNSQQTTEHYFDIKPFTHQLEILEKLKVERSLHQRYRNLVVAATGTGKTIISAFDFARFIKHKPDATFLFVAHRQEILQQAQIAYQGVLKQQNFGELWVGNFKPNNYQQLFASIQTLNSQLPYLPLTSDYYDYIVIDEVHHVSAQSYRGILNKFSPSILLGLTATPERHDGADILADFCGVIAAEIRLPEAINRRKLCPFQYFGIDDNTDLSQISWRQGRYDVAELSNLYTHNDQRVKRILQSLRDIVTDITQIKALAFCVNHDHAKYMLKKTLLTGIPSDILTSDNSDDRQQKQQLLRSGKINILFVVDIFNEGVDIPEVDTLLFLRPTESLTIFLQQLGRGLRLADDKQCCTILDFVGNARAEYDFSQKFRALVGKTNQSIKDEINNGFPHLPLGCRIELTEKTQDMILGNIRRALLNKRRLINLVQNFRQQSNLSFNLVNFLKINPQVALEDIYKNSIGGWQKLLQQTTLQVHEPINEQLYDLYYRAISQQLLGCNSYSYFLFLKKLVKQNFHFEMNNLEKRQALMCHYNFWQQSGSELGFTSLENSLQKLRHECYQTELLDVLDILISRIHFEEKEISRAPDLPIKLHSRYSRQQILAGFGASSFTQRSPSREGVLELKDQNIELLFVTLNKCEKRFSPTTMYHDYAINEHLFHWQSQNSARPDRGKGLSYIQQSSNGKDIYLLVREQAKDENGNTLGFVNFGPAKYVSHQGSQPMNVTWRLEYPMPTSMWHEAAKLAVG